MTTITSVSSEVAASGLHRITIKGTDHEPFQFVQCVSGLLGSVEALRRDAEDCRSQAYNSSLRADRLEAAALYLEKNR